MKLRLIESLRVEMVKPDEIPALWEETASSPGKTGKAEQDVTAGVWRPLKQDGKLGNEEGPSSWYPWSKAVISSRTCLTYLWFTTPTGRGKRLKPVQVSVRIRSELPKFEISSNF